MTDEAGKKIDVTVAERETPPELIISDKIDSQPAGGSMTDPKMDAEASVNSEDVSAEDFRPTPAIVGTNLGSANYAGSGAPRKKRKKSSAAVNAFGVALALWTIGAGLYEMMTFHPSDPVKQPNKVNMGNPDPDNSLANQQQAQTNDWENFLTSLKGMMPWLSFTGGKLDTNLMLSWMDPMLKAIAVLAVGGAVYGQMNKRKYVQIDNLAMIISDTAEPSLGKTRLIPWNCMEQVDVHYPADAQAALAESAESMASKALPAGPAGGGKEPKSHKAVLHIFVDDGSVVKVKWKDIISTIEPGQFINAMKTWAPDACVDTEFPDADLAPPSVDSGAYTQLWFKYYSSGSDRKRTTHLVAGDKLQDGRFEIAGQVGGGGQGTAYLAVDNKATDVLHREIVLKEYILPVHRGAQVLETTIKKLEHEAAILRAIDHGNIVRLLDSFVEDHRGYLVMEFVSGKQLKDIVGAEGPQPDFAVLPLALQVCDVLTYLHTMTPPVVHRDLTPDNLILQDDGQVKLVDFNVAHQLESAATATVVGKHCYIPPEQFRGKPTAQSDIYAFGCTLYYLLTAEDPEPLTCSKPRTKRETVSEELNEIVARCTSLDAQKRYQTAEEVKADLLVLQDQLKKR